MKVVPIPSWLFTVKLPPWASAIPFEMDSPSPALAAFVTFACQYLSKTLSRFSTGIPSPLSETEKFTLSCDSKALIFTSPHSAVNLNLLLLVTGKINDLYRLSIATDGKK